MRKTIVSAILVVCLIAVSAFGKPPPGPKATPAPVPAVSAAPRPESSNTPWLRWILEQDGGEAAIAIPWAEMMRSVTGKQVTPFKPLSDPVDSGVAAKIGTALDSLLPKINRPDGPVRLAKRVAMIPLLVEDELQSALSGFGGVVCEATAGNTLESLNDRNSDTFPSIRLTDAMSRRVYYLGISFCPLDSSVPNLSLVHLDPKAATARVGSDGSYLLIVLEHNGKSGADFALMNWKIIDLLQGKVRLSTAFEAGAGEIVLPAATVGDGRRGRD